MTLKRRFFSAPTLTQALLAAARHHSADPDTLEYKVIDKKQGFIKAPRGVVIEVDPDTPVGVAGEAPVAAAPAEATHPALEPPVPAGGGAEVPFEPAPVEEPVAHPALEPVAAEPETEQEQESIEETAPEADAPEVEAAAPPPAVEEGEAPAPEGEDPAPERAAEQPEAPSVAAVEEAPAGAPAAELEISDSELQEVVAEAVDELAFLASLRVQLASVKVGDDGLEVELEGPDGSRLAARGGRALLAMQHLLPRLLFGRLGKAMRCHVDCDDFHAARSERLEGLAQKAAERVRSGGRSWLLEPMAPDERRLVHLALSEVADIETESVGEGFLKRVRVAQVESA